MSWTIRRKTIINQIMISIQEADSLGTKIDKEKLIAHLSLSHGTARRKALEYINTLKTLNHIKETWDKNGTYLEINKLEQDLEL